MQSEPLVFAHIMGSLYGQALGSAWCMPAYFRPQQTRDYFEGWITELSAAPADHPLYAGFKAGQITVDTHLAFVLAQALVTEGRVTPEMAVQTFITWYDQLDGDNTALIMPNTRHIVNALKTNAEPDLGSLDCNTHLGAMGVAPIGLIHAKNSDAAIQDTITFGTAIHMNNIALSGACAVSAAIAQALSPNITLEDIIDAAIGGAHLGLEQGEPGLGASVARKIDMAVNWAVDGAISEEDRLQNLYDLVGVTLSAADVVPCAFGILAMVNGDPVEGAIYAAALSGKADAVGAIVCAIGGAWQTLEAVPVEYLETLQQANAQYDFEEIAEGLAKIAQQNYKDVPPESDETLTSSFLDSLS